MPSRGYGVENFFFWIVSIINNWKFTDQGAGKAEELNQSQRVSPSIMIGLFFCYYFQLRQSGFRRIESDGLIRRVTRSWKRSDPWDSNIQLSLCLHRRLRFLLRHKRSQDSNLLRFRFRFRFRHWWKPALKRDSYCQQRNRLERPTAWLLAYMSFFFGNIFATLTR